MIISLTILSLCFLSTLYLIFKLRNDKKHIALKLDDVEIISFDLTGSAEQVSTVSRDLYNASQEQLDCLNSTVSASHEINSMIMRTNDNARELDLKATNLENMATDGRKIVSHMVASSLNIKDGSNDFKNQMQESITELKDALSVINEIADKTKLINEIVFQTKLLSFNASVEAARAGEHGRGFAVVAEEIGKLAQVSGNSSLEISAIVEKSVTSVNAALEKTISRVESLTGNTITLSQTGYQQARDCEDIFSAINEKISEINTMVRDISTATKEQSIGVEQLDHAIIRLQEVADRNRLVASQSTEHAHAFEQQTKSLIRITQDMKFYLPKDKNKVVRLQQFIWNDKLYLGVDVMDDEHKILINFINALVKTLEDQYVEKDKDALILAYKHLAEYTTEHFAHEEKFMQTIKYPLYSSHKKIHDKLLAQLSIYGEEIKQDKIDDQKLISFLRNWLISHIMGVDMQYADHYRTDSKAA